MKTQRAEMTPREAERKRAWKWAFKEAGKIYCLIGLTLGADAGLGYLSYQHTRPNASVTQYMKAVSAKAHGETPKP